MSDTPLEIVDETEEFTVDAVTEYKGEKLSPLAAQIAAMQDLEGHDFEEWGLTLRVQTPTMDERGAMIKRYMDKKTGLIDLQAMQCALISACVVDPDTFEPVWTNKTVESLKAKNGRKVWELFKLCQTVAGIGEDSPEEEAEKIDTAKESSSDDQ